jgi:hypothetical protein
MKQGRFSNEQIVRILRETDSKSAVPSSAYSPTTPRATCPTKQSTPRSTLSLVANCAASSSLDCAAAIAPVCRVRVA